MSNLPTSDLYSGRGFLKAEAVLCEHNQNISKQYIYLLCLLVGHACTCFSYPEHGVSHCDGQGERTPWRVRADRAWLLMVCEDSGDLFGDRHCTVL